ncbi:MAG: glycosyltransferase [Bacteroidota bacterium]
MTDLKNIYILTNTLLKGGAEKQSVLLAAVLNRHFDVHLVLYYGEQVDQGLLKLTESYGIKLIRLDRSHFHKWWFLFKLFRANRNSVVFSYLATTNFVNALLGRLAGVRFLVGGIRSDEISLPKLMVQRFLHNRLLNYTIFNNYGGQSALIKRGFAAKKCKVIHNGIDLSQEKRNKEIPERQINIVSVGRFVFEKDYFTAIQSVKKLVDRIKQAGLNLKIKYFLIGYGELEETVRRQVSEAGLDQVVEVVINPPNMARYLAEANIYLSTSLREGLSNAIMEAMEYCLPIVATNVGDNLYLVEEGFNGYLTAVKDTDTISEKLFYLAANPRLISEMGGNSYVKLKNGFTMDMFHKHYSDLIDEFKKS